jgi:hypothetical protein
MMRFTLVAVVLPFVLATVAGLVPALHGLQLIAGLWFFAGVPAALLYGLVRVARRAWHGEPARG